MKRLGWLCLSVWMLSLLACGNAEENNNESDGNKEGVETTAEPDVTESNSDESSEDAKYAMLEAINQWRSFVDNNKSIFTVDEKKYACDGWGGSLVFAKENGQLRAITANSHGEHGHEINKFYFDENDELVMVLVEEGSWVQNTDKIARTLYYVDDNAPFFAMHKAVEGPADKVVNMLDSKEFEEVALDMKSFRELVELLPDYEKLSQEGDVQAYFCQ